MTTGRLLSCGKWQRLNLTTRITIVMLALVLVTAAASAGLIFSQLNEQLVVAKRLELERETKVQATRFADRIAELGRDVRIVAGTPPIQGIIRASHAGGVDPIDGSTGAVWKLRLTTIFREMLRNKPQYLQARYIGVADGGRELVRVEREIGSDVPLTVPDDKLQQKGDEAYFKDTIGRGAGELYLSPIELNREYGKIQEPHRPVLRAALAIAASDGTLFGVVVVNLKAVESLDEIARVSNPGHHYYVVNRIGGYLLHPDPNRAFAFDLRPDAQDSATANRDFPRLLRIFGDHHETTSQIHPDGDRVTSIRRVELGEGAHTRQLAIIVTDSLDDVTTISRDVARDVLLIIGALILVAAGVGFWLARSVTQPVVALANSVRKMDVEAMVFDVPEGLSAEARDLAAALTRVLAMLRRYTENLEANNRELQQFAYIASHDLQEPMRTIASYVEILAEDHIERLDEEGQQSLKFIGDAAVRSKNLIHGLLEYSRLGKESSPTSIDLSQILADIQSDLAATIEATNAEIVLAEMPVIHAYAAEVRALFHHLVDNALRYRRHDVAPKVTVDRKRTNNGWQFTVTDNGIGIAEEHRDKIFLIFQRLNNRKDYAGDGIGLAHCSKIVALHHGKIHVEEAPGGGSRFVFDLNAPVTPPVRRERAPESAGDRRS